MFNGQFPWSQVKNLIFCFSKKIWVKGQEQTNPCPYKFVFFLITPTCIFHFLCLHIFFRKAQMPTYISIPFLYSFFQYTLLIVTIFFFTQFFLKAKMLKLSYFIFSFFIAFLRSFFVYLSSLILCNISACLMFGWIVCRNVLASIDNIKYGTKNPTMQID